MSYAGPASRGKRTATHSVTPIGPSRTRSSTGAPNALRARPELQSVESNPAVFAAGMAVGALLGAGVALLFAPRSGAETRHAIGRRGRVLSRRGHESWEDLRDELRRARRRAKRAWARSHESDYEDD